MESFEQYEERMKRAWLAIRRADYPRYKKLIEAWTTYLEGEAERLNPLDENQLKVIEFPSSKRK